MSNCPAHSRCGKIVGKMLAQVPDLGLSAREEKLTSLVASLKTGQPTEEQEVEADVDAVETIVGRLKEVSLESAPGANIDEDATAALVHPWSIHAKAVICDGNARDQLSEWCQCDDGVWAAFRNFVQKVNKLLMAAKTTNQSINRCGPFSCAICCK